MKVEAGGVKGQVVGVAVGGFEVAIGVELWRVPKAASEVGQKRQLRPELRYFSDEDGVLVNGSESVVERIIPAFDGSGYLVYAVVQSLLRGLHC